MGATLILRNQSRFLPPSAVFSLRFSHLLWLATFLCGVPLAAQRSERACPAGDYAPLSSATLPSQLIYPTLTAPTQLRNPLEHDETKTLLMITVGDSVMWGNGLDTKDKFMYLAALTIANKTQRTVELRSYAHSGAVLDATFGQDIAGNAPHYIPKAVKGEQTGSRESKGDLNAALPTIFQEENCAALEPDGNRAEIVLMDGCINNVGAENIALPFSSRNPKKLSSEAMTGDNAQANCNKLYDLAEQAKRDFPHATIVLTNYYQVVTKDSSLLEGFNQFEVGRVLSLIAKGVNGTLQAVRLPPLFGHKKWEVNSEQFYRLSNRCFGWAMVEANSWPRAGLTATEKDPCPNVDLAYVKKMQNVRAQQAARVFLAVKPGDDPKLGFGVLRTTQLWGLPQEHSFLGMGKGHRDEVYEQRKQLCQQYYQKYFDRLECKISPLAHPRQIGAAAYAAAIAGGTGTKDSVIDIAWAIAEPEPDVKTSN
jgi:hypothetical protein